MNHNSNVTTALTPEKQPFLGQILRMFKGDLSPFKVGYNYKYSFSIVLPSVVGLFVFYQTKKPLKYK